MTIFLLLSLYLPDITFATSGSCSSHNGVNCSIGQDIDGSVICNDGWRDSTVSFYQADECKISCTPPSGSGCQTENDYGALNAKITSQGGYLGGSASQQGALQNCRNEINSYQADLQTYNQCLANQNNNSYTPTPQSYTPNYGDTNSYIQMKMQEYCIDTYGSQSFSDIKAEICRCNTGYKIGKSNRCITEKNYCAERIGNDSYFNASDQSCTCNEGYFIGGNQQCTPVALYCSEKYEINSWYDKETGRCSWCSGNSIRQNGQCVCSEGTHWSVTASLCVANPTCPDNSSLDSNYSCQCNSGYNLDISKNICEKIEIKPQPIIAVPKVSTPKIPKKEKPVVIKKDDLKIKSTSNENVNPHATSTNPAHIATSTNYISSTINKKSNIEKSVKDINFFTRTGNLIKGAVSNFFLKFNSLFGREYIYKSE